MVHTHVLHSAGFGDEGHVVGANDVAFLHSRIHQFLEDAALAFSSAELVWSFQPSLADGDAMNAKHVSHAALVAHALVADNGLRWSKRCNPATDEGFCTDTAFGNSSSSDPPALMVEGANVNS